MTTLTPKSARRLALAYHSALALEEALNLLAKPSEQDPLLSEHAENMMLDASVLAEKLRRLMKATETDMVFSIPLPDWEEHSGPERKLKILVDELAFMTKHP